MTCSSVFGAAPVNPDLAAQARRDGRAEALIVLQDQATPALAELAPKADYKARRRALVDTLRNRADADQAGLRRWLQARGVEHRPFWIANVIYARLSPQDLAVLAARSDVSRIEANPAIAERLPKPSANNGAAQEGADAIAWGVSKINAPLVWAEGFTGQGVVIAGQDTGYHWKHPALKPQYRGWDGSNADHNYNWHDAIHKSNRECPADSPQPCDDDGHGTHTAGTFAGSDGGRNKIGVAPGARWIGCRNMDETVGTPASYIECMEWLLAPTNLKGKNPNPDLAPDIVSNSWSCTVSEGCRVGDEIKKAVVHLVKGGIFFVASASNDGSSCGTIVKPSGIYASTFTIGATDSGDRLAGFSSRGPVADLNKTKPDASAPGVSVYSARPPDGYGTASGTSMAAPHVAGTAALVLSAAPHLKGDPNAVARLLRRTAVTEGVTNPVNQTCGGTSNTDWPNNMVGHGRIDAYKAYKAAVSGLADLSDDR